MEICNQILLILKKQILEFNIQAKTSVHKNVCYVVIMTANEGNYFLIRKKPPTGGFFLAPAEGWEPLDPDVILPDGRKNGQQELD